MTTTRRDLATLGAALLLAQGARRAQATEATAEMAAEAAAGPGRTERELRALYLRFAGAQNARDLAAVRALFWESPDFLWVSDGRPFWGPDAVLARMAAFQKAETWRVEPDLSRARAVEVAASAAYLSLPLVLVIGEAASPARLGWLVGMLCRRQADDWRIAALFTTADKS